VTSHLLHRTGAPARNARSLGVEIERKFLVPELPEWLGRCPSHEIEQGYLAIGSSEEVRVRRIEDEALLTVKRGQGESRLEVEVEISPDQCAELWPLTEDRRVSKRRYRVEGPPAIEVDVYGGALEGLVVAEIEFESEAAAKQYEPPEWLGPEKTGNPRYANETLAVEGVPPSED
jgi:adenylate cyclase